MLGCPLDPAWLPGPSQRRFCIDLSTLTSSTMSATETDWRRRYTAVRLAFPSWACDNPDRLVYTSNASGKYEVYAWDRTTNEHRQVTDRPAGTGYMVPPRLDPAGKRIYWFDDAKGNELGHFRVQLFGRGGSEPILEEPRSGERRVGE